MAKVTVVNVGDLVPLITESKPRAQWPTGLVTEICPRKDGRVCVCEVKTATSVLKHFVHRSCPLQVSDC